MNGNKSGPVNWPEQQRAPAPPGVPAPAKQPPAKGAKARKKNKKIANSLIALSSAAIVSVYGLGYARTQSAEARLTTNIAAENTPVAIATAAPTTTTAPTATVVAQSPAFNPPFLTPSGRGSASVPGSIAQPAATATAVPTATAAATATKGPATTAATTVASTSAYKDGTYTGTGTSRHGSITASVVIQGGKIASADITQCGTRYPCSQVSSLPGEVVARQSSKVDFVSGATDSSIAYQGAVASALKKAAAG